MRTETRTALLDRLAEFDEVVEIGIGTRTTIAASLVEAGVRVTATDVVPRAVPPGVEFVRDDVTAPTPAVYEGAAALYALNFPPELHRSALSLARRLDVPLLFTTLGADPAEIPVRPETLPGDTLFRARRR